MRWRHSRPWARIAARWACWAENCRTRSKSLIATGKPVALVALGNPYVLRNFPAVTAYLATFSTVPPSEIAAVRALFGEIPIRGRLPVTIPGQAAYGDGIQLPATASALKTSSTRSSGTIGRCSLPSPAGRSWCCWRWCWARPSSMRVPAHSQLADRQRRAARALRSTRSSIPA